MNFEIIKKLEPQKQLPKSMKSHVLKQAIEQLKSTTPPKLSTRNVIPDSKAWCSV